MRKLSKVTVDPTGDANVRFTAEFKEEAQREMRAIMAELKRQEDWLAIAEEHGYDTAELVEKREASGTLDTERALVLAEVLKSKGGRQNAGYKKRDYQGHPAGYYQPPAMMAPFTPGGYRQPVPWTRTGQGQFQPTAQMFVPAGARPRYPGAKGPRMSKSGVVPDKSSLLCYACGAIGHHAGDQACPYTLHSELGPPGLGDSQ